MADKKKVTVNINGYSCAIIGEESEEYIQYIAKYVDGKVKEILNKNNRLSQSMVAMLAAITIADEYYKANSELIELKENIAEPLKELEKLRKSYNLDNNKIQILEEECEGYKVKLEEMKKSEQTMQNRLKQYEEDLALKEKEIQNSQKIISQLQNKLFENQIELVQTKKELEEFIKTFDE